LKSCYSHDACKGTSFIRLFKEIYR
jgi:hypothetical protein